jgi:DNA-binding response OmpR family regulator
MQTAAPQHKWSYVFDEATRILVVDDDPILREFASVYLSTPLCEVTTAPDGAAALELLQTNDFTMAVFDIEMPGIDGFELVRRVREIERLRHLPIVMLTSREDIASIDRAFTAGATAFSTKPVNWRVLSYQLRYVIRASRQADAASARSAGLAPDAVTSAELVHALESIIACAKTMAAGCNHEAHAAQSREIAALAESLRRSLMAQAQPATVRESAA